MFQIPLKLFYLYNSDYDFEIINFLFLYRHQNNLVNTAHCNNNVKDSDETDVDCGGVSCDACTDAGQ